MVSSLVQEWFSIQLDKPHVVLTSHTGHPSPSSTLSSPTSITTIATDQNLITGTITITLTKAMNARSLNIQFSGLARSAYFFDSSSLSEHAQPCLPCDKFSYSCDLIDNRIPIFTTNPKQPPRTLPAGTHTFPFSIPLPETLPSVLTTDPVNINYQLTVSLQPASFLPFAQPYQITKPVILLRVNDVPEDNFYSPRQVQFASKNTDRVQGKVRVPYRVLPNCGTVPLNLHLNLRGDSTSVSKVAIELWERAFRLQEQPESANSTDSNSPTVSRVQVDERRVSCQICSITDWPSCSSTGETIEVSKRLMFKVPQLPLDAWADELDRIVSTDRRSSLPKGSCNISGVYSLVGLEIQHMLRAVVFVDGQLSSESSSKSICFPVEDIAQGETRVHILGLQEQQPQGEDETELPSYHRSFMTVVVDEVRLAEMDRRSFDALQDFEMLMTRSPVQDATAARVTVAAASAISTSISGAGNETVAVTVHPPCYEESIRSSFASSRGVVSADGTRGPSLDQRSLHDSLWGSNSSNSGRPSISTDTYAQDLANYTERYSYATPLSNAS